MTPAQKQYMELKQKNKDCLLFFRMWDFYETFFDDAKIASKELDIVLTHKDKNSENPTPMAWVPYHSIDKYLPKLIEKWYKIAIAEQTWEVIPWQLVKREVVKIMTPWTYLNEDKWYNNICAIVRDDNSEWIYHISYWDFSIGEYYTKSIKNNDELLNDITYINPAEIIFDVNIIEKEEIKNNLQNKIRGIFDIYDIPYSSIEFIKNNLKINNITWYWKALECWRDKAFWLLLNYLLNTQKQSIKNISQIKYINNNDKVNLDENTIRNLEIFKSSYEWEKKYSLFSVINNTNSWMWNRKMIDIVSQPSKNINIINSRLDDIDYFLKNNDERDCLIEEIKKLNDIPKIISTLIYKKNSPLILNKLKNSLNIIFWENQNNKLIKNILRIWKNNKSYNQTINLIKKLNSSLKDDADENDYIKKGYNSKIDELKELSYNSSQLILEYQKNISDFCWIWIIKIKFINNQWYFIETTKKESKELENHINKEDEKFDFIRIQTLKNQERYTSTYLQNIQTKIIKSKEELNKLQREIIEELKEDIIKNVNELIEISDLIWYIDVISSYSLFSEKNNWTRPIIKNNW